MVEIADVTEVTDEQNEEEKIDNGECVENLSVLTEQEVYERIYNQEIPIIVYLYTDWCGWCRYYTPVFEAVCRQREGSGVEFYKINPEKVPLEFNLRVYPTTYFFYDDDAPFFNEQEAMEEEELNELIDYFLSRIGQATSKKAKMQGMLLFSKVN